MEPVRVLVLTFNRTLRGYIKQLSAEQITAPGEIALTVETFGGWALSLVGSREVFGDDCRTRIRSLLTQEGIRSADLSYFLDEVDYVLGRFPPARRDNYLESIRSGRGISPAVPRPLRRKILAKVIDPYERWKSQCSKFDWNDIALEASKVPCQGYDVVVVDESQDLSANQIRAILAHLDPDHVTTFIIDAVQRIYPQGFQWPN